MDTAQIGFDRYSSRLSDCRFAVDQLVDGVRFWPDLLDTEGPLTEVSARQTDSAG